MSRGRPRHHSSRRRMYSSRQRDLRERRSHQPMDAYRAAEQAGAVDDDEIGELDSPSGWSVRLSAPARAA